MKGAFPGGGGVRETSRGMLAYSRHHMSRRQAGERGGGAMLLKKGGGEAVVGGAGDVEDRERERER